MTTQPFEQAFANAFPFFLQHDPRSHEKWSVMAFPYFAILLTARSRHEISRLVEILPDNCQLIRRHIIDLERFWVEHVRPLRQNTHPDGEFDGGRLAPLLAATCPTQGLTLYYWVQLMEGRPFIESEFASIPRNGFIISSDAGFGKDWDQFLVTLEGDVVLTCGLRRSTERSAIGVRLSTFQRRLTRRVTELLLTLPESPVGWMRQHSDVLGSDVDFWFVLEDAAFSEHMRVREPHVNVGIQPTFSCFVAEPGLLPIVQVGLQRLGVPVGRIEPVLESPSTPSTPTT